MNILTTVLLGTALCLGASRTGSAEECGNRRTAANELRGQLSMSVSGDPEVRRDQVVHGLKYLEGDSVQILRLLSWVKESEKDIRVELLSQWLAEKSRLPALTNTRQELLSLCSESSAIDVKERGVEIAEAYSKHRGERRGRIREKLARMRGSVVRVDECADTLPEMDCIVKTWKSGRFLGSELFYMDSKKRLGLYRSVPESPVFGDSSDQPAIALYLLLWRFESSKEGRAEGLLPRLEKRAGKLDSMRETGDVWGPRMEPLIRNVDPQKAQGRRSEIKGLNERVPRLTREEIERMTEDWKNLDKKLQRISRESRERNRREPNGAQ